KQSSEDYADIKDADDEAGDFPAVILAVNVDYWEHEQVGVNKRDHAAKTDAAVPKHCSQRNVANGTDERNNRDGRSHDWPPKFSGDRMRHQEKFLPKIVRHPGSERARDEQTASNIFPYSKQIHDEVVTRSCETILRGDALPERAC